jgi:serine/threonine-protein phosphatase PGAM5
MTDKIIEVTDHHHPRIEEAFRKYFYRAPVPEKGQHATEEKHEFEIIVGHANCIRYMICR